MIKQAVERWAQDVLDDCSGWTKEELEELIQTCKEVGVNFWRLSEHQHENESVRKILNGDN